MKIIFLDVDGVLNSQNYLLNSNNKISNSINQKNNFIKRDSRWNRINKR